MFASIRRYRVTRGSIDDLARRVDESFANDISRQPGFASYQFLDCGGGHVATISVFETAEEAEASRELAERWTVEHLQDMDFTRLEPFSGRILVRRDGH